MVQITFHVRHDKGSAAAHTLHLIISTPEWERRVDYSCRIAGTSATKGDKRHLLTTFLHYYPVSAAVRAAADEVLEELSQIL